MFQVNPRISTLAKSIDGATAGGSEDGQLVVPARIQPVVLLADPIRRTIFPNTNPASAIKTSTQITDNDANAGVTALRQLNMGVLDPGLWYLVIFYSFQFVGTTNVASFSELELTTPEDATDGSFFHFGHVTGAQFAGSVVHQVTNDKPVAIKKNRSALIAGDTCVFCASVHAYRVF